MSAFKFSRRNKLNTDMVEFINKDDIKFKFSYIVSDFESPELSDSQRRTFEPYIKAKNTYEDYYFILWTYKYFKYEMDNNLDYISDFLNFVRCFSKIKDAIKNKLFEQFPINDLLSELSKIKIIQNKLKTSYATDGYPTIEYNRLIASKEVLKTLNKYQKLLITEMEKYIKDTNPNILVKSFYSENLDTYMNLLHINKDSDLAVWLRYQLYQAVNFFFYNLNTNLNYLIKDEINITFQLRNSYNYLISNNSVKDFAKNISQLTLDDEIYELLLEKYKSQQELINSIVVPVKSTSLTKNDFFHIKEFDIMSNCIKQALKNNQKGINILLWGNPGTGKTELAHLLIQKNKANGYMVGKNTKDKYAGYRNTDIGAIDYKLKELRQILKNNNNAIILFDEAEDFFKYNVFDTKNNPQKGAINELLENTETPIIWTTNDLFCFQPSFLRRFTYICEMNDMPKKAYKKLFNKICKNYNIKTSDNLFNICFNNKISVGVLSKVFETASLVKDTSEESILLNLKNTYKAQNYGKELEIFNGNQRSKKFDPALLNTSDNLYEFSQKMKKLKRTDFSLLLYGVSGAGKSYYAEYLADELNMPIIKKKASDLESMYVGETEHNIAKAFKEALEEKAILVIDEGDHFISERSKHLRSWETSRTEEMLQQIENHPYPVIFTTNLMNNIDKAAMRRFTYKTKFDYLTNDQVKVAWKDFFPKAKLPTEIHLSKLCPGDFATVYKKAEFEGYLTDTSMIYKKLQEEQDMKKELEDYSIKF